MRSWAPRSIQLALSLVTQRETGQLKRYRGTPVPVWTFIVASFVSSIFVPVDQLPGWLAEIGRIFPLYHVATGVQTALGTAGDTSLRAGNVAVLLAWAVGGVIVAARGFRWEPRATAA